MEVFAPCVICGTPSVSRCSACHTVPYCGLEHQKQDWRVHKKVCPSFEIKSSPEIGQYVVATRNLKKRALIVSEKPVVVGPPHANFVFVCVSCLREGDDNIKCPRCSLPICGLKCPGLRNVTRHGPECDLLNKIKLPMGFFTIITILPLRCLLLQKHDPKNWEKLLSMADRAAGVIPSSISSESRQLFQQEILTPLAEAAPEFVPDYSPETVKKIYNALDAYGVGISCPEFGPAVAVFPVTSIMEHSCLPNSRRLMEVPAMDPDRGMPGSDPLRCRVVVRAHEPISKGENITSLFLDCVACTYDRQTELRNRRNVVCKCTRCLDPRELGTNFGTLRCSNALCTGWVLSINTPEVDKSDWKCNTCDKDYSADDIEKLMKILHQMIHDCQSQLGEIDDTKEYEAALIKVKSLVHPDNYFCYELKEKLQALYGRLLMANCGAAIVTDFQLKRTAELGRDVVNTLVHPAILSQYGTLRETSMRLAFAMNEIGQRKVAANEWTEDQAKAAKEEGRKLCARGIRMRYSWLNETPQKAKDTYDLADEFSFDDWRLISTMNNPLFKFA